MAKKSKEVKAVKQPKVKQPMSYNLRITGSKKVIDELYKIEKAAAELRTALSNIGIIHN